ncbi:MAG: sensor histidine kinase [Bdellovibrionales bacterium]|nr:sensor histidine kinase [Bdellovibrionales bacterium]
MSSIFQSSQKQKNTPPVIPTDSSWQAWRNSASLPLILRECPVTYSDICNFIALSMVGLLAILPAFAGEKLLLAIAIQLLLKALASHSLQNPLASLRQTSEKPDNKNPSSSGIHFFLFQIFLITLELFSNHHLTGQIFRIFAGVGSPPHLALLIGMLFLIGIFLLRKLIRAIFLPRLPQVKPGTRQLFCIATLLLSLTLSIWVFSFGQSSLLLQFGTLLGLTLVTSAGTEVLKLTENPPGPEAHSAGAFLLGALSFFAWKCELERAAIPFFLGFFTLASLMIGLLAILDLKRIPRTLQSAITRAFTNMVLLIFLSGFCAESIHFLVHTCREADHHEAKVIAEVRSAIERAPLPNGSKALETIGLILKSHPTVKCGRIGVGAHEWTTCTPHQLAEMRTSPRGGLAERPEPVSFDLFFDHSELWSVIARRIGMMFLVFAGATLVTLIFSARFSRRMTQQLGFILNSINGESTQHLGGGILYSDLLSFKRNLDDLLEIKKLHESQIMRLRVAEQVEHDIRSPLLVLRMLLPKVGGIKEEERRALFSSLQKITEISNDLRIMQPHGKFTHSEKGSFGDTASYSSESRLDSMTRVKSALESLVRDKSFECAGRNPIHLDFDQTLESLGLHTKKDSFSRVISNLLNNAIEASAPKSGILVSVRLAEDQSLILSVMDQGRGIPEEDLDQVGVRGFSRGKPGGSGLGLSSARDFLAELGARLEVNSILDVGTTVSMLFPRECWCELPPTNPAHLEDGALA